MTLRDLAKQAEKFAIDNSPSILTALGVTGTLTTAYLTGKASFKAAEILADERYRRNINRALAEKPIMLEPREKVELVWRQFIPSVGTGVLTVTAIVAANRIGTRRAAAVAAAYSLSEKAFTEYREKVLEKVGKTREQAVQDELAQDRVNANPVATREVIIAGGEVLCYEAFTARYFMSDMETLKRAMNAINYRINHDFYASLSDFYDLIDLPRTSISDEVGWNGDKLMDIRFSTVLSEDGRPCISIDYTVTPIRDYARFG